MPLLDWIVLIAYGVLMIGVGVYYHRQNRSADDFLLGGRNMSPVMMGLSLFATLVSTLSYLGTPGEMIAHGPMLFTQNLAHPLIFVIVGYGLIPLLMRQPVTSAYELLETRLGTPIRLAGAGYFLLLRLGWMATILYATSEVVLVPMLRVDRSWTPWLCIALGAITAMYSSSGGIKAVVVTDAIQSITMLAGAIVTILVVTVKMGGIEAWWPTTWPDNWQQMSWGFDPNQRLSFGVLMLSTVLWYVCTNGSDQMSIQRFLSTRDASAARKTLAVAQIADVLVGGLLAITGIAILGYYRMHPSDLLPDQSVDKNGDQLFPLFIMTKMPAGLSGLVLAAILSAALSSLSAGVNSACAVLERDFVSRWIGTEQTSVNEVARLKWLTWIVAIVAMSLSILNTVIAGNIVERCYKVVNLLTAPLFVLFYLALFVKWANPIGAWLGLLSSTAVAILIAYSKDLQLSIPISFVWMVPCSLLTGVIVGTICSALFHPLMRHEE